MAASDRIQYDRARLVSQFRHESDVGDAPSRADLDRLLGHMRALGLRDAEAMEEAALLQGLVEADAIRARLERGDLPVVDPDGYIPTGDLCHFVVPVRFGPRRLDHLGHLLLTSTSIRFRGAVGVTVAWPEVESIRRDGREIVVALHEREWTLRFWCHSYAETAIGVVIGEYLRQNLAAAVSLARLRSGGP